jgi:hypothetical protein
MHFTVKRENITQRNIKNLQTQRDCIRSYPTNTIFVW